MMFFGSVSQKKKLCKHVYKITKVQTFLPSKLENEDAEILVSTLKGRNSQLRPKI